MGAPSPPDIIHAYRHLYRGLLRAVQFSKPARYTARDQLRDAFRQEDPVTFDRKKINRTLEFLRIAAQEAGLEHRILKNILRVNWERRNCFNKNLWRKGQSENRNHLQDTAMAQYDITIAMLNDNMGLCLR